MPILNDSIYGGAPFGRGFLGLRACSLSFVEPASGKERVFSIPPLKPDEI
jgi:23S rRNA-/tRNA-specific pseudouridylate synthase